MRWKINLHPDLLFETSYSCAQPLLGIIGLMKMNAGIVPKMSPIISWLLPGFAAVGQRDRGDGCRIFAGHLPLIV